MQGKIIKGVGGFYYVNVSGTGLFECRARGIFRKERRTPLVGDDVRIEVISQEEKTGNLVDILPRRSQLIRPAVANIDQALVIFASVRPAPNLNLLDRFLVMMRRQQMPTVICFNKIDLISEKERENLERIYRDSGCRLLMTSALEGENLASLRTLVDGRTTAVAGPSGVGKSSLVNALGGIQVMETGNISEKIDRGRHTTRHSQLIPLWENTYIMDTPGFSSLYVEKMEKEELKDYIPEFYPYEGKCRFLSCTHTHEPGCAVKKALEQGQISQVRYENYTLMYEEIRKKRRY